MLGSNENTFDLGYGDIVKSPRMRPFAKSGEIFGQTAALVAPVGALANAAKGVNTVAQPANRQRKRWRARRRLSQPPLTHTKTQKNQARRSRRIGHGYYPHRCGASQAEMPECNCVYVRTASWRTSPIAAVKALDLGGSAAGGTVNILKERFGGGQGSKTALRAGLKAQGLDDAQIDELAKKAANAQAGETSAQATGSPEIKRMQNMLAGLNEEFAGRVARQADRARDVQNSKIRTVVDEADQAVTIDQVNARVDNANRQLDKLVNKAQARAIEAQSSLRNMDDQSSRINAATEARKILTTALEDARTLEKAKWNKIPTNAQVNVGTDSEFAKAEARVKEEYNMPAEEVDEAWRIEFDLDQKSKTLNKKMSDLQRKAKGKEKIQAETLPAGKLLKLRTQFARGSKCSSGAQQTIKKPQPIAFLPIHCWTLHETLTVA